MKKCIILLILLLFSAKVYPFWIWSPKTQEWKNPKYSALATPYLQYKQALKLFEEEQFTEAYQEFKKLLVHYPDAREAAEAQYYLARCLVKFDKQYEAFLEYQKLIDSYPNSQRINEAVEREYNIGEYFLNREHKKWLGLSLYDFVEHPSIEIFRSIVNKVPYSEYAPRAQYKLGIILTQLSRYEEARESFQKVIDNYSDSEWAAPAKYQLALATSKAFPGADYDSSYLSEATSRLDEFIKDHPEVKISSQAQEQLAILRNKEAKKSFDTGQFYENQDQYKSSIIYYKKVVNDYPDSSYYDLAVERIEELEGLIKDNITKSDLKRRGKEEAVIAKRVEKARLKEEKVRKKQARREEKLARRQQIRAQKIKRKEEKIKAKQERAERKQELKRQRRQEKINRKREAKAAAKIRKEEKLRRKRERRDDKIKAKQERIRKKKELKEQRRQSKLNRRQEAKLRKQTRRDEKLARRQEIRNKKIKRKEEEIKAKQERVRTKKELKEQRRQEKIRRREEKLARRQELREKRKKKFWFW